MEKEKQIEEMAKIIDQAKHDMWVGECPTYAEHSENIAKYLYNAGYRKASEVAERIFAEIETSLSIADFKGGEVYYAIRAEDYLHYKKKYTEEGK